MTSQFYKTHTGDFFKGKKAVVNKDIKNNGGQVIGKGETVTISGKSSGLIITSKKNVYIKGVECESVDLV